MNDIEEVVDLPDPAVQPLVHPLDLPQARRHLVRGWLASVAAHPAVVLSVAALVWFASRQILPPILAGGSLLVFGALVGRYFTDEAWAYIPRRRQDRQRRLPLTWEVGESLLVAVLLAGVLVLIVARLGQSDVPVDVRTFTFGMAVGAAAIVVVGFLAEVASRSDRRGAWLKLPGVLVVVGAVGVALGVWFDDVEAVSTPLGVGGAVTMVVLGAAAGVWRLVQRRRELADVSRDGEPPA
jgi:hypothetical protein